MSQPAQVIPLLTDLKGQPIYDEAKADAAGIIPGMLVAETATGVAVSTGATPAALFADSNPTNGSTIDTAYAAGEVVRFGAYHGGQPVNALVAAGADAIAKGAALESAGDGTLQVLASGQKIGHALEAVDNSGGAELARIAVRIG